LSFQLTRLRQVGGGCAASWAHRLGPSRLWLVDDSVNNPAVLHSVKYKRCRSAFARRRGITALSSNDASKPRSKEGLSLVNTLRQDARSQCIETIAARFSQSVFKFKASPSPRSSRLSKKPRSFETNRTVYFSDSVRTACQIAESLANGWRANRFERYQCFENEATDRASQAFPGCRRVQDFSRHEGGD
jgi:hypothetical protein